MNRPAAVAERASEMAARALDLSAGASRWLLPASVGAIVGLRTTIGATALAALVFSGPLAVGLPIGIGVLLFSAAVAAVLVATLSTYPGAVAQPQDGAAAVTGLLALSVFTALPAAMPESDKLATVLVAIGLTTLATGGFFMLLGGLRLGGLVRFMPYPVLGGFLAGSGWLFVKGSFVVMTGSMGDVEDLARLLEPDTAAHWIAGFVLAAALLLAARRQNHHFAPLAVLLGSILLFYLLIGLSATTIEEARAGGWLLGPFPEGGTWQPLAMLHGLETDWRVLLAEAPKIATVAFVSVVALLLNATGLEIATKSDMDLSRELRAAGVANLVCGAGGGVVGFQALSASMLGQRMGATSRAVGLIAGAVCVLALLAGTAILSYVPRPLLGGLLLFIGLGLLIEWLYDAWFRLPPIDWAIIVLIVLVIARFGYMEGVGVGIALAIVIFAFRYSRVSVVKQALSGAEFHSNVERSEPLSMLLKARGDQITILKIGGFIFFGTANGILKKVIERTDARERLPCRFVVLDFRSVEGMDCSAIFTFTKMRDVCARKGVVLVLTGIAREMWEREFCRAGFDGEQGATFRLFEDLDQGLEWCEDQVIRIEAPQGAEDEPDIDAIFGRLFRGAHEIERFEAYLTREAFAPGDYLIQQGERLDDMFFIERGRVRVALEMRGTRAIRLRSMGRGTVVGEIAAYLGAVRTASVIAEQPTVAYRLSSAKLRKLETLEPRIAAAFHKAMAVSLSRRLSDSNDLLQKVL